MEPTAETLARTYSDRVYPDPWEKVRDYRRVCEYSAEHPNAGRVRVGNALGLPASRVRGWLNNSMPDPIRGINTAVDHGWIEPDPEGPIAAGLVELLAHVLAGGSISKDLYVPAVAPGVRVDADEVTEAFASVGVETGTRHDDANRRSTEIVPTCDGSVLGRCLVAMGAPHGEKTTLEQLPPVLWDMPHSVRRSFARIYIRHRGSCHKHKATTQIQLARPVTFIEDLRKLFDDVINQKVAGGDRGITVSADAARELRID